MSLGGRGTGLVSHSNGNLTSKTEGSDTWTYQWNAENQLTKVEKNGVEVARFAYDPRERRVEKVAAGVTSSYTYDAEDVVREVHGTSTLKFVHGPGIDEPLASEDATAPAYLHADGLGSIARTTTGAGAVALTREYDAWGNLQVSVSGPRYAFTGREWDPEAGLYYYRARYFVPKDARFISEDPIGLAGGVNRFSYVGNKPTTFVDPSGLKIQICNRPAEGLLPGNHTYFYNPDTGENCGRGENSGKECPDDNTTCQTIPGSEGAERLIMANCEAARGGNWAQGGWRTWRPFTNDCHNFMDYVMRQSGFPPQKAPGGRFGPTAQPYRPDPRDSMCYGGVCMQTGPRDF